MSHLSISGSCLCNAVRFTVKPPFIQFYHCHCSQCRKSTGTAHATNLYAKIVNFSWVSGIDNITRYDLQPAKRFACVFCKTRLLKLMFILNSQLMNCVMH